MISVDVICFAYQVNLGWVVLWDLISMSRCFGDSRYYLFEESFKFLAYSAGCELYAKFLKAFKFIGSENFTESSAVGATSETVYVGSFIAL
jgi:hypothetical protein